MLTKLKTNVCFVIVIEPNFDKTERSRLKKHFSSPHDPNNFSQLYFSHVNPNRSVNVFAQRVVCKLHP